MIGDDIYMTSFNAEPFFLSKNGVYHLKAADFMTEEPTLLTDELDWPNDMTLLPEEMFGYRALAVGHGFLVPFGGHTTGGVSVINLDDPSSSPVKVTKDIKDWFYHKAYYRDMDGDGDLDLITARCRDNVIPFPWNPENKGTLIWLENPGEGKNTEEEWEEHELMDGPDFLIDMKEGFEDSDTPFELLAPQFLTKLVNYVYIDESGQLQNRCARARERSERMRRVVGEGAP